MKLGAYTEYDSQKVGLAECALFTIWPNLEAWHDDLVLVGGLVPRYICGDVSSARLLPRPVTLDADMGIALGASAGGMSSLQFALLEKGFHKTTSPEGLIRYEKRIGDYSVPVDFLTESPPHTHGTAVVDDIVASVLPGIDRALKTARTVTVTGKDLADNPQIATVRVCEVGPFLAMKLRAFIQREEGKDAFDILYTLLHYDRGTAAAVAAFVEETRAGNAACPDALRCLEKHFQSEASLAPTKAARFFPGPVTPNEPAGIGFQRLQIQQEMVNAAGLLKAALAASSP
ncbi:MAG: hypothetical protein ABSD29_17485 [Verrucomicrobiota bacterium]|jgi:hypothetical protein